MARHCTAASTQYFNQTGKGVTAYPFTVAGWFRITGGGNRGIIGISNNAPGGAYMMLHAGVGGINFECFDGASTGTGTLAAVIDTNWHHAIGIGNTTAARWVFYDGTIGVADTTALSGGELTASNATGLGAIIRPAPAYFMDGDIGECAMWNVVLGQSEATALAKGVSPLLIRPSALVRYWPFTNQNGTGNELERWAGGTAIAANTPTIATSHPPTIYPVGAFSSVGMGG